MPTGLTAGMKKLFKLLMCGLHKSRPAFTSWSQQMKNFPFQ